MAKIAVVIPYFGQLPNYFNLYLNSLKHTPYIEVLFVTDIEIKENLPKNFKVIKTSLASLSDRIEKTLGIDINIKHPIKLCDFKPTWGHVFETELKSYDFWAFGDIDVVYGDVQHFLPENWQQKDIISFVPNWLSGSLCLIKNNDTMRTLYQRSEYWKEALGAADHWAFDECHHLYTQLRQGHGIDDLDDKQSFTWVVNKMQQTGEIDAYLSKRVIKEKVYLNESLRIEPGRVSQQNGENFATIT
ncbi:hypothetical protein JCM19233_2910 [Vibrio astriarenae]|nr:hypothetical protein JCM19233_2910 [Vibrio sp. C7]